MINITLNITDLEEILNKQGQIPKAFKNPEIGEIDLIKGKPTYVCCWEVIDKQKKIIEVNYVGTHEKAPY